MYYTVTLSCSSCSSRHLCRRLPCPCPALTNIEIVLIIWVSNKLNQSGNRRTGQNETMERTLTDPECSWPVWESSSPDPAPRPRRRCRGQCPGSRPPPRAAACRWCCHTWRGPTSGTRHATWWWSHSWSSWSALAHSGKEFINSWSWGYWILDHVDKVIESQLEADIDHVMGVGGGDNIVTRRVVSQQVHWELDMVD